MIDVARNFENTSMEKSRSTTLKAILWFGGTTKSSFHDIRLPKPATPITNKAIYWCPMREVRWQTVRTYGEGNFDGMIHHNLFLVAPNVLKEVHHNFDCFVPHKTVVALYTTE